MFNKNMKVSWFNNVAQNIVSMFMIRICIFHVGFWLTSLTNLSTVAGRQSSSKNEKV